MYFVSWNMRFVKKQCRRGNASRIHDGYGSRKTHVRKWTVSLWAVYCSKTHPDFELFLSFTYTKSELWC